MPQWSHLRDTVVSVKVVPVRSAAGCIELMELATASSWSPPSLEMVNFSLEQSVRKATQITLAQYRGRFHDVRLIAGMAGIGDIAHGEYIESITLGMRSTGCASTTVANASFTVARVSPYA
jgi:hypothetical protein